MSDRTGRKPKGTMVRLAPDWFSDNLAMGTGVLIAPIANQQQFWSVALYNNSKTGQLLKVYGLSVANFGGGGCLYFFLSGTFGNFDHKCGPIRPDFQAPDGAIYTQQQAAAGSPTNPFITGTPIYSLGTAGEAFTIVSPFALFIIPPGYSLVAANAFPSVSSGNFLYAGGASFAYHVAAA